MLAEGRVERYELLGELATGGMATVYLGRQHGAFGFQRTVAIKSMHPQFAKDDAFRAMFLDEAHITAKIRHPNVVPTLDVVFATNKLLLVMEYVDGVAFSALIRAASKKGMKLPIAVSVAILHDALQGLHAAHELADDLGEPLGVVHRDVSPQNLHVGLDGMARVLDFGIAKAAGRRSHTRTGEVKGKLAYMAPEQLFGEDVDRRVDVYAAGVVLWEALTGRRLFQAEHEGTLLTKVMAGIIEPASLYADEPIPEALDRAVLKALSKKREDRFANTEEMARAIATALPPASRAEVKKAVQEHGSDQLVARSRLTASGTPMPMTLEPEARAILDVLTRTEPMTAPIVTRSNRGLLAVFAAMCVVGLSLGAVGLMRMRKPSIATAAAETIAPPPAASPPPPTASAAPAPTSVPEATASASASVSAARRPSKPSAPKATTSRPSEPRAAAPDCTPPYSTDAEGHRHYKEECFTRPK